MGIDPRTSHTDGIFVVPKSAFSSSQACFDSFYIAHFLEDQGYEDTWYDALNMDEQVNEYTFTAPSNGKTIYFTVETYYQDVIPNECTTGDYRRSNGYVLRLPNPLVAFQVYRKGKYSSSKTLVDSVHYTDQKHTPIVFNGYYSSGQTFVIRVKYTWFGSPHKDYTVKVYSTHKAAKVYDELGKSNQLYADGRSPSEFKDPQFCGMDKL